MTTPNDAPRPTSELVKEIRVLAGQLPIWGDNPNLQAIEIPMPVLKRLWPALNEAAASLQSLEARNKELEGALTKQVVYRRFRWGDEGTAVHNSYCCELCNAETDGDLASLTHAPECLLHPATKTGET